MKIFWGKIAELLKTKKKILADGILRNWLIGVTNMQVFLYIIKKKKQQKPIFAYIVIKSEKFL